MGGCDSQLRLRRTFSGTVATNDLPMTLPQPDAVQVVFDYHERTKHHLRQYARSLGYMDWKTQPNPFRSYEGAERIALDHPSPWAEPCYDHLFTAIPTQAIDRGTVSRLFFDSLALSAWKQVGDNPPWSLRVNPSSGALHPTEGYLIAGPIAGLSDTAGVFHYSPFHHALERRRTLADALWTSLAEGWPSSFLLIAMTSICWREAWKYGERAFRYCHLDVGHAIGGVALAAQLLGWRSRLVHVPAADFALLLGVHTQHGTESEHPDCLLALFPESPQSAPPRFSLSAEVRHSLTQTAPAGEPNRLSHSHHDWPIIDAVAEATKNAPALAGDSPERSVPSRDLRTEPRSISAEQIVRQRRSAVNMDGATAISRETFLHLLARVTPTLTPEPFAVLPGPPRLALALFVHRVDGLPAGLYLLTRDSRHERDLRPRLDDRFVWKKPSDCPSDLGLFLLAAGDARRYAKLISCHQDIAADGAFAVAMLAEFESTIQASGAAAYCWLHWEAGLIGQVLYLEAEAANIRATGIGCFFDDATHELLGLKDRAWQTVYHFTCGGAVDDPRLQTLAPYRHLETPR